MRAEDDGEPIFDVFSEKALTVPLDYFACWLGEQLRLIGEPKGILHTSWLEDEVFYMRLTLA